MDATTLLQHRDFVTAVARALLRNESDVEDAVQETYVAALQSDPPRTGRVRPWLGGITRNIARNLQRTRGRRRRREEAVARPDRAAAQSAEKLRWQQRVVEEVLALESKYRDVLLLRFYEELPPREIAKQLDLPVNTVRTQTRRALARLRKRFDERYGSKAWTAALAALFVGESAFAGKAVALVLIALVAGTAWFGHNAWRSKGAGPARRGADRAASADAEHPGASIADSADATGDAEYAKPLRFRGRILDWETKPHPPLGGATVYLSVSQHFWYPVAQTTTDGDGRFSFPWSRKWDASLDAPGNQSYCLYVRHEGRWSEPLWARDRGLDGDAADGMEMAVQLLPKPNFLFVRGEGRAPVVGASVSIHPAPTWQRTWFDSAIDTVSSDAQGLAELEWPTYLGAALLRIDLPNGDRLLWQLDQEQARTYDPYDLALDEEELASVTVHVLESDGTPVPAGTQVFIEGNWAPDGDSEEADWTALMRGAQACPLVGATDSQGTAVFRFPADRARYGVYVPHRMVAYDQRRHVVRRVTRRHREHAAKNGRSLPTLQFGTPTGGRPKFCVAGDRVADIEVHCRGEGGRIRVMSTDPILLLPGRKIHEFEEPLGPLRGDGRLVVVAESLEGFAWAVLPEVEFLRCLRGDAVVQLGALHGSHTVRLESSANQTVRFEAVDVPIVREEWINAGWPRKIELPDVSGLWRVHAADGVKTFDPRKRRSLHIESTLAD